MCGIVGLFAKTQSVEDSLGKLLSDMLVIMSDRGPDSAGVAVYKKSNGNKIKVTLQSEVPSDDFPNLNLYLSKQKNLKTKLKINSTHAVLELSEKNLYIIINDIKKHFPKIRLMSTGSNIEIYKEVGAPESVVDRFNVRKMSGSHGIGHTRMATESAVTTLGAHPFSTGKDQCLVHNGSLSNHNTLRRELQKKNISFETQNDTEVAASYLTNKMSSGADLRQALELALKDLDGFYTFVVGTKKGFGVLRDPIACKPAVLAETDEYVAFGSEYRALASLPYIEKANVWEPEPATVYFWEHNK
ncbi:MAG: glutamine amidotransferase [Paracoccaceae bacterium]